MALSVTGINSAGRVATSGAVTISGGILIPKESAGIGDLIYKNGTSNYVVIGRGTATGTTVTVGSTTYTLWGCIYGFVAGMAMVCAPTETSKYWASSGYPSLSGLPTYGGGTVLMRNGNKCTYAQMNTARQSSSDSNRGTAGSLVHPTASYNGGVMTERTFNSSADAKKIYGTWTEYLRQTLRVNGAPGTPVGAVTPGVKVHEFGRWMTSQVGTNSLFPAAYYCWTTYSNDTDGAVGTWWLPSMFELGEMMIDEHWNKMNDNSFSGWSVPATSSHRWSSTLYSASSAWHYYYLGVSDHNGVADYSLAVRPVTLLKLV